MRKTFIAQLILILAAVGGCFPMMVHDLLKVKARIVSSSGKKFEKCEADLYREENGNYIQSTSSIFSKHEEFYTLSIYTLVDFMPADRDLFFVVRCEGIEKRYFSRIFRLGPDHNYWETPFDLGVIDLG